MYNFTQHGPLQPIGDLYEATGALPSSSWCSNTNPQAGCLALTNICKPMDGATLEVYKNLQRQLNRLLKAAGKSLLDVDGRIGSKTLSAINSQIGGSFSHCDQAAATADSLLATAKAKANSVGAVAVADPPRSLAVASRVDPVTNEVIHPPQGAGFLGMPWWLVIAAGVGGYLVYQTTQPAKKKRKPTKRKRVVRRRKPRSRTTVTRY